MSDLLGNSGKDRPGKIVEVPESAHSALVDVAGVTRQVDLILIQDESPEQGRTGVIRAEERTDDELAGA